MEITLEEELFLAFYNDQSKRHAVIEDDGVTAWFYLHGPSDDPRSTGEIDADVLVYNRNALIDVSDVKKYKPAPPPIAKGYGNELAVCATPLDYEWSIEWLACGESAVLLRDGEPWCMISEGARKGSSKAISKEGPWGNPWTETEYIEANKSGSADS